MSNEAFGQLCELERELERAGMLAIFADLLLADNEDAVDAALEALCSAA